MAGYYGKRPLWQWIAIYLIIGLVVYGLIYYFVLAKKGGINYGTTTSTPATQQQQTPSGGTGTFGY